MRVLSVVHQPDAGSGVFGYVAESRGDELVEWRPPEGPPPPGEFQAVMVFGGAMHPSQDTLHPWLGPEREALRDWIDAGTPLLTTCLGAELLAEACGAEALRVPRPEIGWYGIELTPEAGGDPVLGGLPALLTGFQWHSYGVPAPEGGTCLAQAPAGMANAFRIGEAWGLQFHAEVTHEIAANWIRRFRDDPDAVAAGLQPEPLLEETERRIGEWNAVGRRIAGAFLDYAARRG